MRHGLLLVSFLFMTATAFSQSPSYEQWRQESRLRDAEDRVRWLEHQRRMDELDKDSRNPKNPFDSMNEFVAQQARERKLAEEKAAEEDAKEQENARNSNIVAFSAIAAILILTIRKTRMPQMDKTGEKAGMTLMLLSILALLVLYFSGDVSWHHKDFIGNLVYEQIVFFDDSGLPLIIQKKWIALAIISLFMYGVVIYKGIYSCPSRLRKLFSNGESSGERKEGSVG